MALGAVGDAGLAERVGRAIGLEARAMGVNLAYAPVCDLASNPANPAIGIRSFGDDPAAVARSAPRSSAGSRRPASPPRSSTFRASATPPTTRTTGCAVLDAGVERLEAGSSSRSGPGSAPVPAS